MMTAYLRIVLGGEHHALAVGAVREVVLVEDIVPVPGAGPHVLGVQTLRGELIPVVALDGLVGARAGDAMRLVVVQDGERRAAFVVDRAEDVEELEAVDDGQSRGVLHDGRLVGVLDVPSLLDAVAAAID